MGKRLLAGSLHPLLYLALNPSHVVDIAHHGFFLLFSNFILPFGIGGLIPAFALCFFCFAASLLVLTSPILVIHQHFFSAPLLSYFAQLLSKPSSRGL